MHPFLIPGAWLIDGTYFPSGKAVQPVTGLIRVRPAEEFPETLRVEGEVRSALDPAARPACSTYHLDLTGSGTLRFRMDSMPLGTVLFGEGVFDEAGMIVRYTSPERRIIGVETFTADGGGGLRTSGVLLADGVAATSWLARLSPVRSGPPAAL